MPGPKMGPRPPDFNETSLKQSPTYIKWLTLSNGEKLRYACREFIKGHEQDDERLLRRIMIARRNNIRDHETLKVARQRVVTTMVHTAASTAAGTCTAIIKTAAPETTTTVRVEASNVVVGVDPIPIQDETQNNHDEEDDTTGMELEPETPSAVGTATTATRTRRPPHTFSDAQIEQEMDVAAVLKTRSYRTWLEVPDGGEFVYNQKYIKGRVGQDWLLRKNIWRRMRYRRENKQLVLQLHRRGRNTTVETSDPTRNQAELHATASLQQRKLRSSSSMITNSTGSTGVMTKIEIDAVGASLDLGDGTIHDTAHLDGAMSTVAGMVAESTGDTNNNDDSNNNHSADGTSDDTTTASAAAAAVAAVAASLADEAAVEAAVAAAESHFHFQQQQQQQQQHDDDDNVVDIDISESDVVSAAAANVTTALDEVAIAAAVAVAAAVVASTTTTTNLDPVMAPNDSTNTITNTNIELIVDEMDMDDQRVEV